MKVSSHYVQFKASPAAGLTVCPFGPQCDFGADLDLVNDGWIWMDTSNNPKIT